VPTTELRYYRAQMSVFAQPDNTESRTEKVSKEEGITVVALCISQHVKKDSTRSKLSFVSCLGG